MDWPALLNDIEVNSGKYNVLCGGMSRSASTWLYNAARLLVSQSVGTEIIQGWVDDLEQLPPRSHAVIKLHDYDPDLVRHSSHVLYSYRDIRDVLASMKRIWNKKPSIETADRLVSLYQQWTSVADYVVRYDDILADKAQIIERMAETLGIDNPHTQLVLDEVSKMSYFSEGPKTVHNRVNLFHKQHVTDGRSNSWQGHVKPMLIAQIERKHQNWFEQCGLQLSNL